ncbi:hypothetical protein ACFUIW_05635 [Streptomyces sp. NPDC057245]|uniref:hypothetical protein n=1 Tax=Streptomyces sp. NPDC057245 TaxID=3346065 RepID=UPI003641E3B6
MWSLKADTLTVAEGTLTGRLDSYELGEDLDPQAKTLVFSAGVTSSSSRHCTAGVEWQDPRLC